jgi:hypothetical protein
MAEETDIKSGGCQCGAVRYCAEGFKRPSICHCRMCQKAVGGPFAALVVVENLSWTRGENQLTFRAPTSFGAGFAGTAAHR